MCSECNQSRNDKGVFAWLAAGKYLKELFDLYESRERGINKATGCRLPETSKNKETPEAAVLCYSRRIWRMKESASAIERSISAISAEISCSAIPISSPIVISVCALRLCLTKRTWSLNAASAG